MKNIYIIILLMVSMVHLNYAQLPYDAVRFSQWNAHSSARTAGVGGAYGALGADLSALSYNPGGIGVYRTSEFMISPSYYSSSSESILLNGANQSHLEQKGELRLNNLGVVIKGRKRTGDIKTINFALSSNLLANYDQDIFYEGISKGSISNSFVEKAAGKTLNELDSNVEGMAYDAGAIYEGASPGTYQGDLTVEDDVNKKQTITRTGKLREFVLGLGVNYKNNLMIGLSVGFPTAKFRQNSVYSEDFTSVPGEPLRETSLTYTERYGLSGVGVNMKIGGIYKLNKKMRVGLALHTPTVFSINDTYRYNLAYSYDVGGFNGSTSIDGEEGELDYEIVTPWKSILNFAYLFGKRGFLSADLEYVNYASSRFEIDEDQFDGAKDFIRSVNNDLRRDFNGNINLKLGGEYVNGIWRVRGGVGLYGAAFEGDNTFNSSFSLGGGIRGRKAYLDIAYVTNSNQEGFSPYTLNTADLTPNVDVDSRADNFVVTVGFKF